MSHATQYLSPQKLIYKMYILKTIKFKFVEGAKICSLDTSRKK